MGATGLSFIPGCPEPLWSSVALVTCAGPPVSAFLVQHLAQRDSPLPFTLAQCLAQRDSPSFLSCTLA